MSDIEEQSLEARGVKDPSKRFFLKTAAKGAIAGTVLTALGVGLAKRSSEGAERRRDIHEVVAAINEIKESESADMKVYKLLMGDLSAKIDEFGLPPGVESISLKLGDVNDFQTNERRQWEFVANKESLEGIDGDRSSEIRRLGLRDESSIVIGIAYKETEYKFNNNAAKLRKTEYIVLDDAIATATQVNKTKEIQESFELVVENPDNDDDVSRLTLHRLRIRNLETDANPINYYDLEAYDSSGNPRPDIRSHYQSNQMPGLGMYSSNITDIYVKFNEKFGGVKYPTERV
jgi:hypothetical protein